MSCPIPPKTRDGDMLYAGLASWEVCGLLSGWLLLKPGTGRDTGGYPVPLKHGTATCSTWVLQAGRVCGLLSVRLRLESDLL